MISSLLSHPMCAAPGLMWARVSACVVAESSGCQVDPKDSTGNQAVTPCLFFRGMGTETWHMAGETQWVHQRWSLVFPSGSNTVSG